MFAIIESNGKQYTIREGSVIQLDSSKGKPGDEIVFDRILMLRNDSQVTVGQPYVSGVQAKGIVVQNGKSKKILVFKYKPKVKYRKSLGHRQNMTLVKIQSLG